MKISLQTLRNINKTWLSLSVALLIGLLTALAARSFLSHQIRAISESTKRETVDVVVAKTELAAGDKLSSQNLAVRKVPVDFAQSGALRPEDFSRVQGKAIAFNLRSGEMIMWSQMETQRAPTFSARLAPGRRAITVVVDEINSISGMLEPGDLIDLMFAMEQNGQKVVVPLLQSVQVMATGQRVADDPKSGEKTQFATVTLDATPEQARSIIIARETGKLTALLRNPEDKAPIGLKSINTAALFNTHAAAARHLAQEVPVLYGGNNTKIPPQLLGLPGARTGSMSPAAQTPAIAATPSGNVVAIAAGALAAPSAVIP
jgi:pilus assembly protein CpaB